MSAYRRVKLDEALWATLRDVHADVLGHFLWTSDQELHGEIEHWDRPVVDAHGYLRGDCDDFAIECDHRLRAKGIPVDAMCYHRCLTETGEGHLVLGVHTSEGVYILDNRQRRPKGALELARAGYSAWARPQPGHSIADPWQTIDFTPRSA